MGELQCIGPFSVHYSSSQEIAFESSVIMLSYKIHGWNLAMKIEHSIHLSDASVINRRNCDGQFMSKVKSY